MRRQNVPSAVRRVSSSSSATGSPAITVEPGLLATATARRSATPTSSRSLSAWGSATMAIAPWPAIRRNSRLRRQMIRAASVKDSAPATCAAATSPMLWPMTATGSTPRLRHTAASATSMANSAGCITSMSSSRAGGGDACNSASSDSPISA